MSDEIVIARVGFLRFLACAVGLLLAAASPHAQDEERAAPTRGSVQSADGVDILYEVAGTGTPAIVFVHGWSCDRSYWRLQVEHFAQSHRVVAIDLGGRGESGVDREDWTVAAFGEDVRAVLEALDVREAVLVGHSMGGPVVLEAARLAPERVAALVPVDALQDVGNEPSAEQRDFFLGSLQADFRTAAAWFVRGMFPEHADPELVDRIASDMAAAPPDVALSAMESLLDYDEAAALQAIELPVLDGRGPRRVQPAAGARRTGAHEPLTFRAHSDGARPVAVRAGAR